MTSRLTSSVFAAAALAASILGWSATPAKAALSPEQLQQIASKLAEELSRSCPHNGPMDAASFQSCVTRLSQSTTIPFASMVLWGGDQPHLRIKKRHLTRFAGDVFRQTYLPLLTFTGKYTIERDNTENVDIIRMEAYFRNALPAGDYPYPFWHTAAKWDAYETMNQMSFYVDDKGRITIITRADKGSNEARGQYTRITPPAHVKDQWFWTDASGQQQPRVMLFSTRYQPNNPRLARLEETYKTFANNMREASCIACHSPNNSPGAARLILLQTPLHAAGEINAVIKAVQGGSMPENEMGLPADIDPKLREAILSSAIAFRDEIAAATAWETSRQPRPTVQPRPVQNRTEAPATSTTR